MDARANKADITTLNEDFQFWATYLERKVAYTKQINTLEEYKAEKEAVLAVARKTTDHLIHFVTKQSIDDQAEEAIENFVFGIDKRIRQIEHAFVNSSLLKRAPSTFQSDAYRNIHESLVHEWYKLQQALSVENILLEANKAMVAANTKPVTAVAKMKAFFSQCQRPVSPNDEAVAVSKTTMVKAR